MSAAEPETASRASTSRVRISISRPSLSRTRSRNSPPFSATRQASVATRRERRTLARAELGGTDFQRIERARHGRLRQAPGLADAFAEANDAREGIDDAEAAARRAGEQQAAVVGAEVEGAVNAVGARIAVRARGR